MPAHAIAATGLRWRVFALVASTLVAYAGAPGLGTLSYDDPDYATENPHITGGLRPANVAWAFTQPYAANWIPLTWLSHMLDHELFGANFTAHHAVNVVLHVANALLLFALLFRTTGRAGPASLVAALFALHPAHVESVAWLSERKDVLSTALGLGCAHLYLDYARSPSAGRMATVAAAFALALAAKPMVITLPCVFVLLDVWPLGRIDLADPAARARALLQRIAEKWPLWALCAASAAITLSVQQPAVVTLEQFPLATRLLAVPLAYASYLGILLWPIELIPIRLHPGNALPVPAALASLGLVIAISLLAWHRLRNAPAVFVGWAWFVGMLVPVIGLVQVGSALVSDRYTYLPAVGLFIAVVYPVADALRERANARRTAAFAAVAVLVLYTGLTRQQVTRWRDDIALFGWTVQVDPDNHFAHGMLGRAYEVAGNLEGALEHYVRGAELRRDKHRMLYTFARGRIDAGDDAMAARALAREHAIAPDYAPLHVERARLFDRRGDRAAAREAFERALALEPDSARTHIEYGLLELADRDFDAAERHLREAIALEPEFTRAHRGLARVAMARGDLEAAKRVIDEALAIAPDKRATRSIAAEIRRRMRARIERGDAR